MLLVSRDLHHQLLKSGCERSDESSTDVPQHQSCDYTLPSPPSTDEMFTIEVLEALLCTGVCLLVLVHRS